MKRSTIQRVATPTAILVGLAEDLNGFCGDVLAENGLKVLRVSHLAAASERIPIVMPQVVVVPGDLGGAGSEALTDRCVAVGAEILRIDEPHDRRALLQSLKAASSRALARAFKHH